MNRFNVMEHGLVPEHYLLSEKEAKKVLDKLGITREQLPKIRKSDPCIKFLEQMEEIREGRIIKIVRKSPTAGVSEAYRVVIRG